MKLWPPRFLASTRPKVERNRKDEDPAQPVGASGTVNLGGLLFSEEYNQDLVGSRAIDVYERMRRSDPSVRESLWHVFAPILNAEWTVEPPQNATEEELEVTAFVRAAYFEWLNQPFVEYIEQALMYLVFGHAVFETQFQVVERGLKVEYTDTVEGVEGGAPDLTTLQVSADQWAEMNADEQLDHFRRIAAAFPTNGKKPELELPQEPVRRARDIPKRQFVTWRKFHPRLPKTIIEWHVDRADELTHIVQYAPVTQSDGSQGYERIEIPAEYLIVYTNEKNGGEWTGISLLRAAYKPWVIKEMIEKLAGIAFERFGVSTPVGYVPRDREDDDAAVSMIEEMLANLRGGEANYLVFPGPKAQGNVLGYQFEMVSPQGGIPDFKSILEYFRGEIAGALLTRFKELGHATTGARATANVQAEVWYNALHAIARRVCDSNAPAIRRLVDLNYDNVERYPRLTASNIEARNILEFAQTMALLANAKLLNPDAPTRAYVRNTIDAPAEDPDETEMRAQQISKQNQLEQQMALAGLEQDPAQTARPRTSKSTQNRK